MQASLDHLFEPTHVNHVLPGARGAVQGLLGQGQNYSLDFELPEDDTVTSIEPDLSGEKLLSRPKVTLAYMNKEGSSYSVTLTLT